MTWIVKVLKEMKRKKHTFVCVKKEAEEEYREMINRKMKNLVWVAHKCDSWYNNSQGINTTIHPGNASSYWNSTRNVDWSKLSFE